MNLPKEIGEEAINKVLQDHPAIGEILSNHGIGCVGCGVGICQVKDVVFIHALGEVIENIIERDIVQYLETVSASTA